MFFLLTDDDSQKAGPSGLRKIKSTFEYDEDDGDGDDDVVGAQWDISYTKPAYFTTLQNTGTN